MEEPYKKKQCITYEAKSKILIIPQVGCSTIRIRTQLYSSNQTASIIYVKKTLFLFCHEYQIFSAPEGAVHNLPSSVVFWQLENKIDITSTEEWNNLSYFTGKPPEAILVFVGDRHALSK